MKPVLVTSYVIPDLDGSACAVAYAEFLNKTGTEAAAGIIGGFHIEAQFAFEKTGTPMPLVLEDAHGFDRVVLVDTSNLTMFEGKLDPKSVIEIIDHRPVHQAKEFPNAKVQIEHVGAAATLIAERFIKGGVSISKESAALLYGAIASNTLNLKSDRTTERDRAAFRWCGEQSGVGAEFIHEMFRAKSDLRGPRLKEALWSDYSWHTLGNKTVVIAQLEIIGGKALVRARGDEILLELAAIGRSKSGHFVFLNIIELEDNGSVLVAEQSETQALLSKLFGVSFKGSVAWHEGMLLRKDIWVQLKKALEK